MNQKQTLIIHRCDVSTHTLLPYADKGVHAGFPSPAQDAMEKSLDLNELIIKRPASTFFARVQGDSMKDAGVNDGDILVIDKSIAPRSGAMAVCFVDGEFTLKYIKVGKGCLWLVPANTAYPPIRVSEDNDFTIWGIVTFVIHKQRY